MTDATQISAFAPHKNLTYDAGHRSQRARVAGASKMKAAVYHRYGGPNVVAVAEVTKPVPQPNEVLVRIRATTVNSGDWRARSLHMPAGFALLGRLVIGISGPRQPILGTEFAGVVESVGAKVTRFEPGDAVVGFPGGRFGSHAEYRTMPEDGLIDFKPANLSFEEAAALSFGSNTALPLLRGKAKMKHGDRVLVVGASGAVGVAAVQIAKHFGGDVTAVTSTSNVALVASLGADRVIDYKMVDFAKTGDTWDIIFDTTGTVPFSRGENSLRPGGRLVAVQASLSQILGIGKPSKASGQMLIATSAPLKREDYRTIMELAASGALKPVIDRTYDLEHVVDAYAYVDTGRKRGSVVLTVGTEFTEDDGLSR
jgi:NADPH:quinone reductase-like Zn-dependent oxidoreductase